MQESRHDRYMAQLEEIKSGIDANTDAVNVGFDVSMRKIVLSNNDLAQQNMTAYSASQTAIVKTLNDVGAAISDEQRSVQGTLEGELETIRIGMNDLGNEIVESLSDLGIIASNGFSALDKSIRSLESSLDELQNILLTPTQTWACEQFEIAIDCIRRWLFDEALAALNKAINGHGYNTGYPTDYRFHVARGIILMGKIPDVDKSLINLEKAEEAFCLAGRYAWRDNAWEAADAYVNASLCALTLDAPDRALALINKALSSSDYPDRAYYIRGKIQAVRGKPKDALTDLENAIKKNVKYALQCTADPDFIRYRAQVKSLLEKLRTEYGARLLRELNEIQKLSLELDGWKSDLNAVPKEASDATEMFEVLKHAESENTLISLHNALNSEVAENNSACTKLFLNAISKMRESLTALAIHEYQALTAIDSSHFSLIHEFLPKEAKALKARLQSVEVPNQQKGESRDYYVGLIHECQSLSTIYQDAFSRSRAIKHRRQIASQKSALIGRGMYLSFAGAGCGFCLMLVSLLLVYMFSFPVNWVMKVDSYGTGINPYESNVNIALLFFGMLGAGGVLGYLRGSRSANSDTRIGLVFVFAVLLFFGFAYINRMSAPWTFYTIVVGGVPAFLLGTVANLDEDK